MTKEIRHDEAEVTDSELLGHSGFRHSFVIWLSTFVISFPLAAAELPQLKPLEPLRLDLASPQATIVAPDSAALSENRRAIARALAGLTITPPAWCPI